MALSINVYIDPTIRGCETTRGARFRMFDEWTATIEGVAVRPHPNMGTSPPVMHNEWLHGQDQARFDKRGPRTVPRS